MELIAHRGAPFDAPENSLEAFELAIRQGADRIELDVRLSRDGVPMVCHDAATGRIGEPAVQVAACGRDDLRSVHLANGETLPTLAEVCDLANRRVPLDVELKSTRVATAGAVYRVLKRHGALADALLTSFDVPVLTALRGLGFRGRTGLLVGSRSTEVRQRLYEAWPFGALKRSGASDLVIHFKLGHRALRFALRRRGFGLVLWAALEDERAPAETCREIYQQAVLQGADGLIVGRLLEAARIVKR